MFERMDQLLWNMQRKMKDAVNHLLHEEKGASDFVAIMIIIVILLAVAVVFKDGLIKVVNSVFDKLGAWIESQG